MHQKDLAKQAWEQAGLYRSTNPKLRAFLKHVDEMPEACWPELVQEVRQNYPDLKEKLVLPLWSTGDKLLRLNIIQMVSLDQADEVDLLRKLVRRAHVTEDLHELRAVVRKDHPELIDLVAHKRGLDPEFKRQVELQREMIRVEPEK
jgi:hypothetical protein